MIYLFNLGREPALSFAEIKIVLNSDVSYEFYGEEKKLLVDTEKELNCEKLIFQLGGTTKISKEAASGENPVQLASDFLISQNKTGKIDFSFSGGQDKKIPEKIKKALRESGRSARYVEEKNSATLTYNGLIQKKSSLTWFKNRLFSAEAVQDFENFSKRDYGRPAADAKSGLLPPKVARILVNLTGKDKASTLLDPFCGSGTILAEALSLGWTDVRGSDISNRAVEDTKKNLVWLKNSYPEISGSFSVQAADAKNLDKISQNSTCDVIVSEPFMGPPLTGRETDAQIFATAKNLSELFSSCFESFSKIISRNGVVIFIFPVFYLANGSPINTFETANILKNGFSLSQPWGEKPLLYQRPNQKLGRFVYRLAKD